MSEMRELLARALALHARWRETEGKEGERIDLRDASLQGADFRGASLKGASFEGADFAGCLFVEAKMDKALFEKTTFKDASFNKVSFKDAPSAWRLLLQSALPDFFQSPAQKKERKEKRVKPKLRLVTPGERLEGDKD
jgi:hypothetical protein